MTQLFLFSCACFRAVKAGGILVPESATGHREQRYDRSWYARILITGLMHANSDTHKLTRMRILIDDEIRFTSTNVVFKRWKGQYTDVKSGNKILVTLSL